MTEERKSQHWYMWKLWRKLWLFAQRKGMFCSRLSSWQHCLGGRKCFSCSSPWKFINSRSGWKIINENERRRKKFRFVFNLFAKHTRHWRPRRRMENFQSRIDWIFFSPRLRLAQLQEISSMAWVNHIKTLTIQKSSSSLSREALQSSFSIID